MGTTGRTYGWSSTRGLAKHIIDIKAGPGVVAGTRKSLCGTGGGWLSVFAKSDLNSRFAGLRDQVWKRLRSLPVCEKCTKMAKLRKKVA